LEVLEVVGVVVLQEDGAVGAGLAEPVGVVLHELRQAVLLPAGQDAQLAFLELVQELLVFWGFFEGGVKRVLDLLVGLGRAQVPDGEEAGNSD
jgi:hypothetical protein